MSELNDIAATFGVSEPVFNVSVKDGGIVFNLKNKYVPPSKDDPIYELLRCMYNEELNISGGRFEVNISVRRAQSIIIESVHALALKTLPLKNPKHSRLHKWLSLTSTYENPNCLPGFIALYRYIVNTGIIDVQDKTNLHAKNVVAILELMREKYETT